MGLRNTVSNNTAVSLDVIAFRTEANLLKSGIEQKISILSWEKFKRDDPPGIYSFSAQVMNTPH